VRGAAGIPDAVAGVVGGGLDGQQRQRNFTARLFLRPASHRPSLPPSRKGLRGWGESECKYRVSGLRMHTIGGKYGISKLPWNVEENRI